MFIQGLGDAWVIIQIATKVIQVLRHAAKNSPKEVTDLIEEAENFRTCLDHVKSVIDNDGAILKPHDEIKRGLLQVLKRCGELVESLQNTASSYESIVKNEGDASDGDAKRKQWLTAFDKGYRGFLRIKWTTLEAAVKDVRMLLQQHMTALQMIIQSLEAEQLNQMQSIMREALQVMEQMREETGGKLDQIIKNGFNTGPVWSMSPASDSGYGPPSPQTKVSSPSIVSPNIISPSLAPHHNGSANAPPREPTPDPSRLSPGPLKLPSPLIDPFEFEFGDNPPDLTLHPKFLTEGSSINFP
ncbi:hypothetical protein GJ744_004072 [Endocarpon pusillum]|uniref:NACHT-NTPase and P-loop NTPases N-terminal domain-containing protein n=1 Tax=Endocarpon pusillum TaxID=364733 RepID=A0A8H7DXR7_9EURO|nr:hypothetical protein GJ744_004072 [Endocarpon pusillum]